MFATSVGVSVDDGSDDVSPDDDAGAPDDDVDASSGADVGGGEGSDDDDDRAASSGDEVGCGEGADDEDDDGGGGCRSPSSASSMNFEHSTSLT